MLNSLALLPLHRFQVAIQGDSSNMYDISMIYVHRDIKLAFTLAHFNKGAQSRRILSENCRAPSAEF